MIGSISSPATSLDASTNALAKAHQRLASGLRINSAADDAAGLAIATRMAAQLGSGNQALANVNNGLSLANTAAGALDQVTGALQDMRALAVQAANATNSPSDRQALQQQFSQLAQGIDQIAGQTRFNGQTLFDGSFSAQLQTGPNAGETQTLQLGAVSAQTLGLGNAGIATAEGAGNAISTIDKAIADIGAQQGSIGATQASLSSAAANLSNSYQNLAAARSSVADTDFAAGTAGLAQATVQQKAALQAVAIYNANQANVLGLLKKP